MPLLPKRPNQKPNPMNNKIVVLVSGEGTLLQALIDHQKYLNYEIALVISDKENAKAIARAQAAKISTAKIIEKNFSNKEAWYLEILKAIKNVNPALVVLAGFMRILPESIIVEFENKILNSHPALLPAFPGLHAVEQAIAAGVSETGATMHLVDRGVDTGPIVKQVAVKVLPQDTPQVLHQRIKEVEQEVLPKVVELLVGSTWQVINGKVVIDH